MKYSFIWFCLSKGSPSIMYIREKIMLLLSGVALIHAVKMTKLPSIEVYSLTESTVLVACKLTTSPTGVIIYLQIDKLTILRVNVVNTTTCNVTTDVSSANVICNCSDEMRIFCNIDDNIIANDTGEWRCATFINNAWVHSSEVSAKNEGIDRKLSTEKQVHNGSLAPRTLTIEDENISATTEITTFEDIVSSSTVETPFTMVVTKNKTFTKTYDEVNVLKTVLVTAGPVLVISMGLMIFVCRRRLRACRNGESDVVSVRFNSSAFNNEQDSVATGFHNVEYDDCPTPTELTNSHNKIHDRQTPCESSGTNHNSAESDGDPMCNLLKDSEPKRPVEGACGSNAYRFLQNPSRDSIGDPNYTTVNDKSPDIIEINQTPVDTDVQDDDPVYSTVDKSKQPNRKKCEVDALSSKNTKEKRLTHKQKKTDLLHISLNMLGGTNEDLSLYPAEDNIEIGTDDPLYSVVNKKKQKANIKFNELKTSHWNSDTSTGISTASHGEYPYSVVKKIKRDETDL